MNYWAYNIVETAVSKELRNSERGEGEGDRLTTITTPDEGVWKKCCRGCWTGLLEWRTTDGAPPSQKDDGEGGEGMDHLTDPLTVAAALATVAVVCCEIEVGDWGEGGIAEKLFWPLQSAVTAPLGRKDRLQRCTTPGWGCWFCPLLGGGIFSLPQRDSYSRGNARSMKGPTVLARPRLPHPHENTCFAVGRRDV